MSSLDDRLETELRSLTGQMSPELILALGYNLENAAGRSAPALRAGLAAAHREAETKAFSANRELGRITFTLTRNRAATPADVAAARSIIHDRMSQTEVEDLR